MTPEQEGAALGQKHAKIMADAILSTISKPGPDAAHAGCVSCRWGGVPSVRHTVCRTCRPPEWDGWEARENIRKNDTVPTKGHQARLLI